MDPTTNRTLCLELADDLSWLESHCLTQRDLATHAGRLRLAAGLVRNVAAPFLEKQPAKPLHIAVVGGAGAGKSTVVNFLCGASVAEANPQAGFTRHPVAYIKGDAGFGLPSTLGFLGPLHRLTQPAASNLDEDVYQVRRVSASEGFTLLNDFIVWDCPDMTTWAATGYVPRLLEVCALADVIVYVASDERYNDEVPTQFLQLLLQAGKQVVVVLTKMREVDAPALLEHFRTAVLAKLSGNTAAVVAIPHLSPDELADPVQKAGRFRVPLLNQVAVLAENADATRLRTVRAAVRHLSANGDGLLAVARNDLAALETWRNAVVSGQADFDARYRREYLNGERFPRFDEAMVKLIDLLELPGVGRFLSGALYIVRTPYRLIKGWLGKVLTRPEAARMPEQPVLDAALTGWLDQLRTEALRRQGTHPLWNHVAKGFESGLSDRAREKMHEQFREFQTALTNEVDRTSRAIYADLEKSPVLLNSLRGGKFAMDVAAIAGVVWAGGLNLYDLALVPLAASATQLLVDFFGQQYVETQREATRSRQAALETQHVSVPLAEWLTAWPATGGSSFERLQQVLRRIPAAIQKLEAAVG